MARKRLHNPELHKYYSIQQRTGLRRKGQIKGSWHNKRILIEDEEIEPNLWSWVKKKK